MIQKISVAIIVALWIAAVCVAQNDKKKTGAKQKPDLSGTWVLDEQRSETGTGKKRRITDYVLTITHREPEIKMSKRFKLDGREMAEEVIYYTDGRPEYNSRADRWDSLPVTRWDGNKLVRRFAVGPAMINIISEETWVLSDDGQTLTRITKNTGIANRPGPSPTKFVFTRLAPSVDKAVGSSSKP